MTIATRKLREFRGLDWTRLLLFNRFNPQCIPCGPIAKVGDKPDDELVDKSKTELTTAFAIGTGSDGSFGTVSVRRIETDGLLKKE